DSRAHVRLSLLSDAVAIALRDHLRPDGQYNLERMLHDFLEAGGEAKASSSCMDHRGLSRLRLIDGVTIGSMAELANWALASDRIIAF
ncbi:MAG TPA: DsrE family protein, partial [Chthonomonadales bacterium]|nr:DsrE family protein [Chthonomonadales bacterium]